MEIDLGPAARRFRDELRDWLRANTPEEPDEYQPDNWTTSFFSHRSSTIWGGTAQVQRNIVGERVLGLPKGPG